MTKVSRPTAVLATVALVGSLGTVPSATARSGSLKISRLERRMRIVARRVDRRIGRLETRVAALEGPAASSPAASTPRRPAIRRPATQLSLGRYLRRLERRTQRRVRSVQGRIRALEKEMEGVSVSSSRRPGLAGDRIPRTQRAIRRRARRLMYGMDRFIRNTVLRIEKLEDVSSSPPPPTPAPTPSPSATASPEAVPTNPSWQAAGPGGVTCPSGATRVTPAKDPHFEIAQAGAGASLCFGPGTYRIQQQLRPLDGQTLTFEEDAVLSGAKVVTDWSFNGTHWVSGRHTQEFSNPSWLAESYKCVDNPAACIYEDVYFDDKPLIQAPSLDRLGPGKVYFDKARDRLYLRDDPSGHRVEATVATMGISSSARDVTVRGATVEKFGWYGIQTQSNHWRIEESEVRWVHGTCIGTGGGRHEIRNNHIHHGGNGGLVMGHGQDLLIEGNHLHDHNYLHFGMKPVPHHEGATKIHQTKNVIIRNNYSHDNDGDGWWLDWDNIDVLIEGNLFEGNSRYGLFYEASFRAIIRNNVFRRNGTDGSWYGTGLRVSTSRDVEVFDNVFEANRNTTIHIVWEDRGTSPLYGERQTSNLYVHDNLISMSAGYVGVPYGKAQVFDPIYNNRFEGNHYVVPDVAGMWWQWKGSRVSWTRWRDFGFDQGGTLTVSFG